MVGGGSRVPEHLCARGVQRSARGAQLGGASESFLLLSKLSGRVRFLWGCCAEVGGAFPQSGGETCGKAVQREESSRRSGRLPRPLAKAGPPAPWFDWEGKQHFHTSSEAMFLWIYSMLG